MKKREIILLTTLYGSVWAYGPVTLWVAAIPTIGIYCSADCKDKAGILWRNNFS
jgi:hypothetical protein